VLLLLLSESQYFFKYETNLASAVAYSCESCGAGAAVEYRFSRAADNFSYALGVDACFLCNQTHNFSLASRRCRDPQPRSSPVLDIFPFESPPISLTVVLPTSRVSFRLFIGGCLSVSPRSSQFVVGHVLCRADLGHGSYRSFLVLLRFIGEKAGVYRMTAKPLIGASVRSKNEMLEISNTPTGRLSIPDHSVRCQLTLLEKSSAGNARNLAFITKATPLNELQLVVH